MAYGTEPLGYQWHYEDEIMPGMYLCIIDIHVYNHHMCFSGHNNSYCCIFPATLENAGHYYCQVKNHCGVVNTSTAMLIVTTSLTARKPSVASELCYTPSIMENSGPIMLQTQILES